MPKSRVTMLFTALLLAAVPIAASAQDFALPTSPRFVEIVRLAQDGRGDSARATIGGILTALAPEHADFPEALYTAATIASSGEEARLLYSRVAVEHPRSDWADKSLLRLAQLDFGTGDAAAAVNRIRRLMQEYPASKVLASAALWGARAAFELQQTGQACEWLARGIANAGEQAELLRQMEFAQQRCTGDVAVSSPTTRTPERTPVERSPVREAPAPAPPPPPPPPARQQPAEGPWRVQVAAISDPTAIRRVEGIIRDAGYTVYKVPGPGGLTRIQAGPFATREAASAKVAELKAAVGGQPFVTR
ncbi:MAG TPA: SPOR domain-containing protein [Gemmatimonadales bacterium]|nr:SPOR domain-containing protein [Gemmatimonadales bacterium]